MHPYAMPVEYSTPPMDDQTSEKKNPQISASFLLYDLIRGSVISDHSFGKIFLKKPELAVCGIGAGWGKAKTMLARSV